MDIFSEINIKRKTYKILEKKLYSNVTIIVEKNTHTGGNEILRRIAVIKKKLKAKEGDADQLKAHLFYYRHYLKYEMVDSLVYTFKVKSRGKYKYEVHPKKDEILSICHKKIRELFKRTCENIHQTKDSYRSLNIATRAYNYGDKSYTIEMCGGVHVKKGVFYVMYTSKKLVSKLKTKKKPKSSAKYVGVEFEFCAPVTLEELAVMLHKEELLEICHWHDDHSLRPKTYTKNNRTLRENRHEITVLAPENRICRIVGQLCHLFRRIDARVEGRHCGLHVHLDCRDRDAKVVYHNLVACQNMFIAMMPPDRMYPTNRYCRRNETYEMPKVPKERVAVGYNDFRYTLVNGYSYFDHKTVEVRVHEGTVDAETINNWIRLLVKIGNYTRRIKKEVTFGENLKKYVDIDDNTSQYISSRINRYRRLQAAA